MKIKSKDERALEILLARYQEEADREHSFEYREGILDGLDYAIQIVEDPEGWLARQAGRAKKKASHEEQS